MIYKITYIAFSFPFKKKTRLTKELAIEALKIICPTVQIESFCICTGAEIKEDKFPLFEDDLLFLTNNSIDEIDLFVKRNSLNI